MTEKPTCGRANGKIRATPPRGAHGQFIPKAVRRPSARELDRAIIAGVAQDMIEHGQAAAAAAREKDPLGYLKFGRTLVQEHQPKPRTRQAIEQLSDDQIKAQIETHDKEIAALTGRADDAEGGEGAASDNETS